MMLPMMIGMSELLLIGGIALLLFGGKKVPELMRGLGQGVKSFREGMNAPDDSAGKSGTGDEAEESAVESQREAVEPAGTGRESEQPAGSGAARHEVTNEAAGDSRSSAPAAGNKAPRDE